MWVYVFLGNLLRGLGETPIQPLGIAYLDDFASEDNAAFYIGKAFTSFSSGPGVPGPSPSHLLQIQHGSFEHSVPLLQLTGSRQGTLINLC
jgi:hypothetical protein